MSATAALRQRQPDRHLVHVPLVLGQIGADALDRLASIARRYGDTAIYATSKQNLSLRWIGGSALADLHSRLSLIGLAEPVPPVIRNIVACAGSTTCKLGICNARGLASALAARLAECRLPDSESGGPRIHTRITLLGPVVGQPEFGPLSGLRSGENGIDIAATLDGLAETSCTNQSSSVTMLGSLAVPHRRYRRA